MKLNATKILSLTAVAVVICSAQGEQPTLRIKDVMTPQELLDTGVSTLSAKQREALDTWLLRYTKLLATALQTSRPPVLSTPKPARGASNCATAIESTIAGDFEGWSGETVFKLDNGEIWEQAEYEYMYSYQYRPDVTIYATSSGCRMKVEDEEDTILVRRIK